MKKLKKITCIVMVVSMSLTSSMSVLAKAEDSRYVGGIKMYGKTAITQKKATGETKLIRTDGATRKISLTYSYYAYNATKITTNTKSATTVGSQSTITVASSELTSQVYQMVSANSEHRASYEGFSGYFKTNATY